MDRLALVKHILFLIVPVALSVNYSSQEIKNISSLCLFLRFMVEKFQIYSMEKRSWLYKKTLTQKFKYQAQKNESLKIKKKCYKLQSLDIVSVRHTALLQMTLLVDLTQYVKSKSEIHKGEDLENCLSLIQLDLNGLKTLSQIIDSVDLKVLRSTKVYQH